MGLLGQWPGEGSLLPLAGLLAWTLALLVACDRYYAPRPHVARGQRLAEESRAAELERLAAQSSQLVRELRELQELLPQRAREGAAPTAAQGQAGAVAPWTASGEAVPHEASAAQGMLREPLLSNPRRLAALYNLVTTNTASSGCYSFSASTDADVSSATCKDSNRCPICFLATGLSAAATLRIGKCSTAYIGSSTQLSNAVLEYTIINADTTYSLTVEAHATADFSASAVSTKTLSQSESTRALCYSGGSDYLYFQQA